MVKPLLADELIPVELSPGPKAVLRTLLYFDIFNHPLTLEEIHLYLHDDVSCSREVVKSSVQNLLESGIIQKRESYYLITEDTSATLRRKKGEELSTKAFKAARKYTRIIAAFPFVRAVLLTGSLSKGYMDEKSDIDYFIITSPKRLWLARTLLVLFKKSFLLNSRKNFCLNYFISTDNLEIPDRNIFTATELVSVIPAFNYSLYKNFISENTWTKEFLPNSQQRNSEHCIRPSFGFFKRLSENLFGGRIGEQLDSYFFRITLKHWKKKFPHFEESDFDQRLRSRKNVSKHHPLGYQFKVLNAFGEKIKIFESKYGITLS